MTSDPMPGAVSAEQFYFAELGQGRFRIPRCDACGKHHFFPRVLCPHCGGDQLRWVAPSGAGTVYATTTVRRGSGDYTVSLIDLDEGPRLMSRVVQPEPDEVHIGMRVRARIDAVDGAPLLVFVGDAKEVA